jgi:hypothetical protein
VELDHTAMAIARDRVAELIEEGKLKEWFLEVGKLKEWLLEDIIMGPLGIKFVELVEEGKLGWHLVDIKFEVVTVFVRGKVTEEWLLGDTTVGPVGMIVVGWACPGESFDFRLEVAFNLEVCIEVVHLVPSLACFNHP